MATFSHANWCVYLSVAKCGIVSASPPLSRLALQRRVLLRLSLLFFLSLTLFCLYDDRVVFFMQKLTAPVPVRSKKSDLLGGAVGVKEGQGGQELDIGAVQLQCFVQLRIMRRKMELNATFR